MTLGAWLRAQGKLMGVTFLILTAGFFFLRVEYALLFALLITIIDALPVFGTGTVLVPWGALCLLTGNVPKGLGLLALYGVISRVRSVLEPKIMAAQVDLSPLAALAAMYVGFCAFGAVGLYVLVSLVLALLPESWMEEYGKAMRLSTETGLIPALAVVAGAPLAEELVFRGVIQSRLERAMPVWIAIVLQAVLFGFIHGTPVQIGYAFLMGLLFGYIRYRTGSILPTIAAHAAFNAMNDPLGLLGGFAEKWQFLAVMAAVCAAGCVLCRRGLSGLRTAPEAEAWPTSPTVCEEITE